MSARPYRTRLKVVIPESPGMLQNLAGTSHMKAYFSVSIAASNGSVKMNVPAMWCEENEPAHKHPARR